MPKATVNLDGQRIELKSCPGGYVVIKQLPFGMMLKRRDLALKYSEEVNGQRVSDDAKRQISINIMNEQSRRFDFKHCIIDHNLEDDHGNQLDFGKPATLDILDPRIAAEIERAIDNLNQEDFNEQGFTMPSGDNSTRSTESEQPDSVSV